MIIIVESSDKKLILKDYPFRGWLAFICLGIFVVLCNYQAFFRTPIHSYLNCRKEIFNSISCELIESSLLNNDLTSKTVSNIYEAKKVQGSKSNVIKLEQHTNIWNSRGKKVYYPSNSYFGPYLYRTNRQVDLEISQIDDFVHNWDNNQTLTLTREISWLSLIFLLLLLSTIIIPLVAIIMQPIVTYLFDLQKKSLIIEELIFFSPKETMFSLNELEIGFSIKNQRKSIILKPNLETSYVLNDFENEGELLNILNLLNQFILS